MSATGRDLDDAGIRPTTAGGFLLNAIWVADDPARIHEACGLAATMAVEVEVEIWLMDESMGDFCVHYCCYAYDSGGSM